MLTVETRYRNWKIKYHKREMYTVGSLALQTSDSFFYEAKLRRYSMVPRVRVFEST